jgi:hypothetical protein
LPFAVKTGKKRDNTEKTQNKDLFRADGRTESKEIATNKTNAIKKLGVK